MARPNWEYVRVDVLLPSSRKLDDLSRSARWTLIELWCHCGQHLTDGFVRDAIWRKTGTARERQSIVAAGLAEPVSGGYQMHDYLEHQRSRADVVGLKKKRSEAGRKGGMAKANAKQEPEHLPQHLSSKSVAEAEAEAEVVADVVSQRPRSNGRTVGEIDRVIISEIKDATGRDIDDEWAGKIRRHILDGRTAQNPAAYAREVIRREADPRTRFLPQY